jgi:hypothetical protein
MEAETEDRNRKAANYRQVGQAKEGGLLVQQSFLDEDETLGLR